MNEMNETLGLLQRATDLNLSDEDHAHLSEESKRAAQLVAARFDPDEYLWDMSGPLDVIADIEEQVEGAVHVALLAEMVHERERSHG